MAKEKNTKKAFLWNMIGSTSYSLSSFLYLMVVTRICGVGSCRDFFPWVMPLPSYFSLWEDMECELIRPLIWTASISSQSMKYHVSLPAGWCSSLESSTVRGVFSGGYIIISVFIIMMKMVDAVEDVFHGNFQQTYHVEIMGKMLAVRNIYSAVYFTAALLVTQNLAFTCTSTAVTSLILCLVINNVFTKKYPGEAVTVNRSFQFSNVWKLLKICTPLFVGTFLSLLLYNIPKYAMSSVMTDEYQTYYSVLFMPSFVITLMCEFVFKPTITTIAELWWKNDLKSFPYMFSGLSALSWSAVQQLLLPDICSEELCWRSSTELTSPLISCTLLFCGRRNDWCRGLYDVQYPDRDP